MFENERNEDKLFRKMFIEYDMKTYKMILEFAKNRVISKEGVIFMLESEIERMERELEK